MRSRSGIHFLTYAFAFKGHSTTLAPIVRSKGMNRSFAEEALTLPQDEQLRLARRLLEKAEASGDADRPLGPSLQYR